MRSQILTADVAGKATVSGGVGLQVTPLDSGAGYPILVRPDGDAGREIILSSDRPFYTGPFATAEISGARAESSWLVTVLQKEEGIGSAYSDQGLLIAGGVFNKVLPIEEVGLGGNSGDVTGPIEDVRQWARLVFALNFAGPFENGATQLMATLTFFADPVGVCAMDQIVLTLSAPGNGYAMMGTGLPELVSAAKVSTSRRYPFVQTTLASNGSSTSGARNVSQWLYGLR